MYGVEQGVGSFENRFHYFVVAVKASLIGCFKSRKFTPYLYGLFAMLCIDRRPTNAILRMALASSLMISNGTVAFAHARDDASQSLELKIFGKVSPKCELSFSDDEADVVLTEQAGTTTLPFAVDCNQRMNVQMRSLNGGLQHVEVGREPRFNGFANFVPYTATFRIDVEGAREVSAESREMTSSASGNVGRIPFQSKGELNFAWAATPPLLGGQYRDVIEIRVSGY